MMWGLAVCDSFEGTDTLLALQHHVVHRLKTLDLCKMVESKRKALQDFFPFA